MRFGSSVQAIDVNLRGEHDLAQRCREFNGMQQREMRVGAAVSVLLLIVFVALLFRSDLKKRKVGASPAKTAESVP